MHFAPNHSQMNNTFNFVNRIRNITFFSTRGAEFLHKWDDQGLYEESRCGQLTSSSSGSLGPLTSSSSDFLGQPTSSSSGSLGELTW